MPAFHGYEFRVREPRYDRRRQGAPRACRDAGHRPQGYLNTGTAGPLARITQEALEAGGRFEYETGRGTFSNFPVLMADIERLRSGFAALMGVDEREVALTHHTTDGINIVANGLAWHAGDEIVTTSVEHEGGLLPLYVQKRRHGVVIRMVEIGPEDSQDEIAVKLGRAIGPRTRLIAVSHVNWNTGIRMPIESIAAIARERGVLTLVDGAQSAGRFRWSSVRAASTSTRRPPRSGCAARRASALCGFARRVSPCSSPPSSGSSVSSIRPVTT